VKGDREVGNLDKWGGKDGGYLNFIFGFQQPLLRPAFPTKIPLYRVLKKHKFL